MKGTIVIHQDKVNALHLGLDIIDATIISWIAWAMIIRKITDNKGYYIIDPRELEKELPIMNINYRAIKSRIEKMIDVGVFDMKKEGNHTLLKPLDPFNKVTI